MARDRLAKREGGAAERFDEGLDRQFVVHARSGSKIDLHVADRERQRGSATLASVQCGLIDPEGAQEFGPAAFEKAQIIGVIDDAGKIRVLIVDPNRETVGFPHASSPRSNRPIWFATGACAGTASPRWRKACGVSMRPRGVRCTKPSWIR